MRYIGEKNDTGQLAFTGNEYDIVNFYMGNCAQYFVFSILLAAAGYIIRRIVAPKTAFKADDENPLKPKQPSKEDTELDEWFEESE